MQACTRAFRTHNFSTSLELLTPPVTHQKLLLFVSY
uniref:Uncharacterized protein n=1 Tax=Anguilla anguilla TaxID=7936 RepID=A0A0E9VGY4_ANGAN